MKWRPKHARPYLWPGTARSPWLVAAVGLVLCLIVGAGIWTALAHAKHTDTALRTTAILPLVGSATPAAPTSGMPSTLTPSTLTSSTPSNSALPASPASPALPVSLDIPAIRVHTTLQQLGLGADGTLQAPTNLTQAGWYTGSAIPGANGPAIIAGHVDSATGPAVFFNLKSLSPGDAVTVRLNSGHSVAFRVTAVQRYPKTGFPTSDVYGPRPDPELRLITCGGGFSAGHYLDNVVVYAAEQPPAA